MKRIILTIVIVVLIIVSCGALGYLAYKHFIIDQIKDGGDITNPYKDEVRPKDNAKLLTFDVTRFSTMAGDSLTYYIHLEDSQYLLYAKYFDEHGNEVEIEDRPLSNETVEALNQYVLTWNLTESKKDETQEQPLDQIKESFTVSWDDGTTVTPFDGYEYMKKYFDENILPEK